MRILLILSLLALVSSCKTNNQTTNPAEQNSTTEVETQSTEMMNKETSAIIMNNHSFEIETDEFDKSYLVENAGDYKVFKYEITEKGPAGTADGDYAETVLFEFTDAMLPMSKSSNNLQDVKLAFGKQCFCRDAGYYKIEDGSLSVTKKGDVYTVALAFNLDGVTHRMSTVNEKVKAK